MSDAIILRVRRLSLALLCVFVWLSSADSYLCPDGCIDDTCDSSTAELHPVAGASACSFCQAATTLANPILPLSAGAHARQAERSIAEHEPIALAPPGPPPRRA